MSVFRIEIIGRHQGPRLLITAGVHGDEYEPIAAVRQLATVIDKESLSGTVTLVPIANVPAFLAMSRTGLDGLDLARTCPGAAQGTATEAIAHEISQLITSSDFLIDLHTGGLIAKISPLAGYMLHEDPKVLEQQRLMANAFNLPIIWGTNSKLNGRTLSVARDANIPAIYSEWGGGGGCDQRGVDDNIAGCLNVMSALGMMKRSSPAKRVEYIVEDSRELSGVLQNHYLADRSGYFEPACQLRQQVSPGDVLGRIYSISGGETTPIVSNQKGMVILLRAVPPVNAGDFLCVVLDSDGPGEYCYE